MICITLWLPLVRLTCNMSFLSSMLRSLSNQCYGHCQLSTIGIKICFNLECCCRLTHFRWKMKACMTKWDMMVLFCFCTLTCWKQPTSFYLTCIFPASPCRGKVWGWRCQIHAHGERGLFHDKSWLNFCFSLLLVESYCLFSFQLEGLNFIFASIFCLDYMQRFVLGFLPIHISN